MGRRRSDHDDQGDDQIVCPFCGADGEIDVASDVDPSAPGEQVFVQDCAVCCRPWNVVARVEVDGTVRISVGR